MEKNAQPTVTWIAIVNCLALLIIALCSDYPFVVRTLCLVTGFFNVVCWMKPRKPSAEASSAKEKTEVVR